MKEEEYTVVGKNSKLFSWLKDTSAYRFRAISHQEVANSEKILNPIVFSLAPQFEQNVQMFEEILSRYQGRFFYVSSVSVQKSVNLRYNYPNLKKRCENYLIENCKNLTIIRVGVINNDSLQTNWHGKVPLTRRRDITKALSLDQEKLIVEAFTWSRIRGCRNTRIIHFFYLKIAGVLGRFRKILRPLDLVLRALTKFKGYGYSLYEDTEKEKVADVIVVGGGLISLAISKALDKNNVRYVILTPSGRKNIFSTTGALFEKAFLGGNSDKWHGVISDYLSLDRVRRLTFARFFYPKLQQLDGESFVPYKPLRPQRLFAHKRVIYGRMLRHETRKNDVVVYTTRGELIAKRIYIGIGALSLVSYVSKNYGAFSARIDDHRIGYLGTLKLNKSRLSVKRSKHGHFKPTYSISCEGEVLDVSLRPAYFNWRDIEKAQRFRDIYSNSTFKIIKTILKSFNICLILEAIYNKYGIQILKTDTYHLIASRLCKGAIEFDGDSFFEKRIDSKVVVSDAVRKEVRKTVGAVFREAEIEFCKSYGEFRGIHYLGLKSDSKVMNDFLNQRNQVKVYSPLQYDAERSCHHSFDIMVDVFHKVCRNENELGKI